MNLDWFTFWAGINPQQLAITTLLDQQSYSYQDIQAKACQTARLLTGQYKLKKGDRIAVIAQNCIEYIFLFGAAQKCGIILVPLNYRLTSHELDNLVKDAEPSLLIYEEEFSMEKSPCPSILMKDFAKSITIMSSEYQPISLDENDAVFILYTSGSTGFPKGVIYTHKMLFWNSANTSISLGINSNSIALVCMPPFHTGGWNVLLTPILHHGGHIILTKKFDAEEVLEALENYHCNQFMAVPTMLKMMSQSALFNQVVLQNLKYIIVGGEAMPLDLIEMYENQNIAIRQGFGMTEVGPNLTSLHQTRSRDKIGSIGKPNMYVDVKLFDEDGFEVPTGTLGELCFAGPVVMPGYWRKSASFQGLHQGIWFMSGDIAMIDDEGFIYIKDRKKNMYISGGENVYPAEVERFLSQHPNIKEVVIIGIPDPKWGEVGKAFIIAAEPMEEEEIISFCQGKLSKYKIPKHIVFLNEMPVNATGKVDRASMIKNNNLSNQ